MDTVDLFREAMQELKDIKQEIVKLNTSLAITIERQTVAMRQSDELSSRIKKVEESQANCSARKSYDSKAFLIKDFGAILALILSLYAIYSAFK